MDRREQVFVSSTYLDLREERRAVIQGLLEADCIPSGMELFPASDADKWDLIKGVIDDCDYYLLIIGGRYGSVDPTSDLSYTEMEYDYAVSVSKPVMAFLHGSPGSIVVDKTDLEPDARTKLQAFRARVEARVVVKYWSNLGELDGAVAKSLIKLRKTHPAEGWVRARHAMTPEVERDIAELRARVSDLNQALATAQKSHDASVVEGLADGDDTYMLDLTLTYRSTNDSNLPKYERTSHTAYPTVRVTWNAILAQLGPTLLDENDEKVFATELHQLAMRKLIDDRLLPDDFDHDIKLVLAGNHSRDVIVQLFALGLIEHGTKRRPINDKARYWRLTERGRDRMMVLRAIRRSRDDDPGGDLKL